MSCPRLYLGNLPPEVTTPEIKKLCQPFGTVEHIYFYPGTGFAYVEFKESLSANQALEHLHGTTFKERILIVKITG